MPEPTDNADPDAALRSAKERGWRELDAIDRALEAGEIDVEGWHDEVRELIEDSYLSATTPEGQSGRSGDRTSWEQSRRFLLDAMPGEGTLLDVGCANGLLMETVHAWSEGAVEPYGVEISPRLADLARSRCPQWADRIWTANAHRFEPGRRFTWVRTGLDYVPAHLGAAYVDHLLRLVEPGGRLVVGVFNEEPELDTTADLVRSWGHHVAGATTRPHRNPAVVYKALWVDA